MLSRRRLLRASAVSAAGLLFGSRAAGAADAPGVTDTEIKFGQSIPYSGPVSAYGAIGRTEAAYFKMINEQGGVNGRKLDFISLDDAYSPPKTVEATRRLVEDEKVAFIFGNVGTPSNLAIRQYLNDNHVPQLFVASGATAFGDPRHFPWTMGILLNYHAEGRIYAQHILATKPDAKIGVLYQNDGFGKDYLSGFKEGLGPDHAAMIVKEATYEISDPTVDSQIVTLQGSGADTLFIVALAKGAAQAIRKAADLGWTPTRYLVSVSASIVSTLKPAGLEKSVGVISGFVLKDAGDPEWKTDPGMNEFIAFVNKYMSPNDIHELIVVASYFYAQVITQVLKQCGDDLTRENIMRQAANLHDFESSVLLPGVKVNTAPDNFFPIRQLQLGRFDGAGWIRFGELMRG